MARSLLFLPDISGFTKFVQTTESEHSQHVIAELLEVLIEANTQDLKLAEIEGDALFFYKEGEVPSQEKLLAQIETMFTAFYSHLKLLEKNRICPCNACATAPNLQLKIVAHSGDLQFLEVRGNRKPFGPQVIEAHRLLKNSVNSDNYALISKDLANHIELPFDYSSKVFQFQSGSDDYDGKTTEYLFALIDRDKLSLHEFKHGHKVVMDQPPQISLEKEFPVSAAELMEYISNFNYRHHWVEGVNEFKYNEHEVTRAGTEHLCVINDKSLNITTVTKEGGPGELVYGETTNSLPIFDKFYTFYIAKPIDENRSLLTGESYWEVKSPIKKLIVALIVKRKFGKTFARSADLLYDFILSSKGSQA